MYDIKNALTEKSLPLSDNIHGPYKMMLPELLHTSGSGHTCLNHLGIRWEVEKTEISLCCRPPRYVPYKGTYVPYDGTYGTPDQGQMLDM